MMVINIGYEGLCLIYLTIWELTLINKLITWDAET